MFIHLSSYRTEPTHSVLVVPNQHLTDSSCSTATSKPHDLEQVTEP